MFAEASWQSGSDYYLFAAPYGLKLAFFFLRFSTFWVSSIFVDIFSESSCESPLCESTVEDKSVSLTETVTKRTRYCCLKKVLRISRRKLGSIAIVLLTDCRLGIMSYRLLLFACSRLSRTEFETLSKLTSQTDSKTN